MPRVADRETNRAHRAAQLRRKELIRAARFRDQQLRTSLRSSNNQNPNAFGATAKSLGRNLYPTEPSISSSINRLSSTLYSIGNWRTRSLTNPFTLKLIACASLRP